MSDQLTNNPEALRLFFTEDIYLVDVAQNAAESPKARGPLPQTDHTSSQLDNMERKGDSTGTGVVNQAPSIPTLSIPVQAAVESPAPVPGIKAEHPMATSAQQPAAAQRFQYVGANQRNILILVNDAHNPVSTLQGRELLGNILKAIGLNRNDCALVNYASCDGADFNALQPFFKPLYVFAFGVSPDQLGIPGAAYNSIVTKDQSKLIFSSNLDSLSGDAATKKLLWGSLKQIEL